MAVEVGRHLCSGYCGDVFFFIQNFLSAFASPVNNVFKVCYSKLFRNKKNKRCYKQTPKKPCNAGKNGSQRTIYVLLMCSALSGKRGFLGHSCGGILPLRFQLVGVTCGM